MPNELKPKRSLKFRWYCIKLFELIVEEHNIKSSLCQHVERIFYYKNFVPDHSIERVVPTGNIFILFELDNYTRHTFDNELNISDTFRSVWISGMHQKYLNISAHKNSEMLIVQFRPMGAFPFFQSPIHYLNDKVVDASVYFGDEAGSIRNQIVTETNAKDKCELVEKWLLMKFDPHKTVPVEVLKLVEHLKSQPFSKHNELVKGYSMTKKHLIFQFKKYCGLTPKVLHRIFRFNKLLETIHQKHEIIWTDIAYETGYADQSHFIKDFQCFCGFNPSKYIRNGYNHSLPNFFPIDKEG